MRRWLSWGNYHLRRHAIYFSVENKIKGADKQIEGDQTHPPLSLSRPHLVGTINGANGDPISSIHPSIHLVFGEV